MWFIYLLFFNVLNFIILLFLQDFRDNILFEKKTKSHT